MKKNILLAVSILVVSVGSFFAQATYVGPEKCLTCHNNPALHDMTGWRTSMHANGYSVVEDDSRTMQKLYGIVNDADGNGIDDFHDGLDFNNITSAFDAYKPNAPILGYNNGYTITMGDVTHKVIMTYGGSGLYKQRYMIKVQTSEGMSAGYYVSPVQFNEKTKQYVVYHGSDWYDGNTPKYNSTTGLAAIANNSRSLAKNCAGCHSNGLVISQDANGEWLMSGAPVADESAYSTYNNVYDIDGDGDLDQINTTCERCHGAGSEHAATGDKTKIVNPKNLTSEQANNLCGMCHSRGKSLPNNTFGFPYDDQNMKTWTVGDLLAPIYTDGGGNWGDGKTSKDHHQQFYDFYESSKPTFEFHQVTCYECHDIHNTVKHHIRQEIEEEDSLGAPLKIAVDNDNNTLCLSCHATHGNFEGISKEMVADYANNVTEIGNIVSLHTKHPYDPEGTGASRCSQCHMAKTAKSAIAYDIHGHTFEPIPPAKTKDFSMPNSCAVSCHGKDTNAAPKFGVAITAADFTDWAGTNQQTLADSLMYYYGPNGKWWQTTPVSVAMTDLEIPSDYALSQNYPNPFNPTTVINFSLPNTGNVKLAIYNSVGEEVAVLIDNYKNAGNYITEWNATNFASGVYYYQLISDNFVQTKKMLLMK